MAGQWVIPKGKVVGRKVNAQLRCSVFSLGVDDITWKPETETMLTNLINICSIPSTHCRQFGKHWVDVTDRQMDRWMGG